jgi:hypothetical protein
MNLRKRFLINESWARAKTEALQVIIVFDLIMQKNTLLCQEILLQKSACGQSSHILLQMVASVSNNLQHAECENKTEKSHGEP